jgi:hypothetical protein
MLQHAVEKIFIHPAFRCQRATLIVSSLPLPSNPKVHKDVARTGVEPDEMAGEARVTFRRQSAGLRWRGS